MSRNPPNQDASYGQTAYEAYGQNRDWKAWDGRPMPTWEDVIPEIKIAWQVASHAVIAEFKKNVNFRMVDQKSSDDSGETEAENW